MTPKITGFEPLGARAQRILVFLDGMAWAELDPETVVREKLGRGQELDEDAQRAVLAADEVIRARKAAAGHAAGGRKTRRELQQFLRRKGFGADAAARALNALTSSGTIEDVRVGRRHVTQRRSRKDMGPLRIEAELKARGIPASEAERLVEKAFDEVDLRAECARLAREAIRRYQPLEDPNQRRKITAWLMRRGYESCDVRAAIESILKGSAAAADDDQSTESD